MLSLVANDPERRFLDRRLPEVERREIVGSKNGGRRIVAGKPSLDVPPGTLKSILKQAGLKS